MAHSLIDLLVVILLFLTLPIAIAVRHDAILILLDVKGL